MGVVLLHDCNGLYSVPELSILTSRIVGSASEDGNLVTYSKDFSLALV